MRSFAGQVVQFNSNLNLKFDLPDVEVMNPFLIPEAQKLTEQFYHKFYNDSRKRHFIFGINPGRFGAGITGIPFTDPVRLESQCGLVNPFKKKPELSSVFIYELIAAYGGVQLFYSDFFITAVSPLGFTSHGKNLNYYDDKKLMIALENFIVGSIKSQIKFGAYTDRCYCLGDGKNFSYLNKLNGVNRFFKSVIPLPHPRFIMQYRLKQKDDFIKMYLEAFRNL